MAIGGINNRGGGFGFGQRKMGVQLGQKSARELLGGGKVENLIAINFAGTVGESQVSKTDVIVKGLKDEIDRTLGFRTNISASEKKQLEKYQADIQGLEAEAQKRLLTPSELQDRARFYVESYRILGKDYVDIRNDSFLSKKSAEIDTLLATKPKGDQAERLADLKRYRAEINRQMNEAGDKPPITLFTRLRSANQQISDMTRPRKMSTLSSEERAQYDRLVGELNAHAGQELQLDSRKKLKIERLQASMEAIKAGGVNAII